MRLHRIFSGKKLCLFICLKKIRLRLKRIKKQKFLPEKKSDVNQPLVYGIELAVVCICRPKQRLSIKWILGLVLNFVVLMELVFLILAYTSNLKCNLLTNQSYLNI